MNAVIFSVSIFSEYKSWMIDRWISALKDKFNECDIYVGINPDTHVSVIDKLKSCGLNMKISLVNRDLYCESDASGTQAALLEAKRSNKKYEYFWFMHTKGGVNERIDRFEYYINQFLLKRSEIELFLNQNPRIGSYGHYGVGMSVDGVTQWRTLDHNEFDHANIPIVNNAIRIDPLLYSHINWSYVETFYVLHGKAINWLLENANDAYFNTKIKNRWYGEVVIPWLPSRMGMIPYVKYPVSNFSSVSLNIGTEEWIRENNISI